MAVAAAGADADALRALPLGLSAPVFAMAPMVTQSDYAFRRLLRAYGCTLCYTEMLMASEFGESEGYRQRALGSGVRAEDHPLVVQFAANDPDTLLKAALHAQRMGADAVDINLGCPQWKAKQHRYGAWLAADVTAWPTIEAMVAACARCPDLRIPVTCKIRLQPTIEATVDFARRLEAAGCALLTIHGRGLSSVKLRRDAVANLDAVAEIRRALRVPVLANGNVRCAADVAANLRSTGCEGVMVGEQILRDPALFQRARSLVAAEDSGSAAAVPCLAGLIDEYLRYCLRQEAEAAATGEAFSVWDLRACDVVRNHLRSMLVGAVGKYEAEAGTALLAEASLRPNARHFLDWWRLQKASTIADVVACFELKRSTLEPAVATDADRSARQPACGARGGARCRAGRGRGDAASRRPRAAQSGGCGDDGFDAWLASEAAAGAAAGTAALRAGLLPDYLARLLRTLSWPWLLASSAALGAGERALRGRCAARRRTCGRR
eukprot:TRINITY_DN64077_c0_g1_i1.p1 TRINITY_DN64077_c0_g1~~TRINITY_DN64077_c0_g1_i1.p1  ORF type:complete len:525 (-),score=127.79 TRINITY_DN64077_c0_g1_i1:106-1590(-)